MNRLLPQGRRQVKRLACLSFFVALLSVGLFASSASATVMKYAGLERLIEISDVIVHAEVVNQETYFDNGQQRVVTDTTFEIERSFLGNLDGKITIQQWGGTFQGRTYHVPGDAHFEKGEEVVVFLHKGDGVLALSALGQAKYSVKQAGGKKLVSRDMSDMAFMIQDGERQQLAHLPNETRSYESFVAELESLVAGIKGGDRE